MKVRNGFVSNSSSSSFIVIFNELTDFDNFKPFQYYETFLKDLEKTHNEEAVIDLYLNDFIWKFVDTKIDLLKDQLLLNEGKINKNLFDIYENWRLDSDNFCKIFNLMYDFNIHRDGLDFNLMLPLKNILDTYTTSDEVDQIYETEEYTKLVKEIIPAKIKNVFNLIKERNKNIKFSLLEYADDNSTGDYMERYFMPFLAACPEGDFLIYSQNNH